MIRYLLLVLLGYEFSVLLIDSRISGEETWHAALRREEAEDHKYPEPVRKKRQIARQSFQQYLANMGRADYDVREEEGTQSEFSLWPQNDVFFRLAEYPLSVWVLGAR